MFLTGGGGPLLASALPEARLVPHLGLYGLAEVALRMDASGGVFVTGARVAVLTPERTRGRRQPVGLRRESN